jgi:hypothetical protein
VSDDDIDKPKLRKLMSEPGEFDHLSTTEISERLRALLGAFERCGWYQDDENYGQRLWRALIARTNIGAHDPIIPKPLRIRDIKAGDVYKEGDRILWTAIKDIKQVAVGSTFDLGVRYPDHGRGTRYWAAEDGDYELPGLERPAAVNEIDEEAARRERHRTDVQSARGY